MLILLNTKFLNKSITFMRIMPPSELDTIEEMSFLLYAITTKINNCHLNLDCKKVCSIANLNYNTIISMRNLYEKENCKHGFHYFQIRIAVEKILECFPSIKVYWMKTNVMRIKYNKSASIKIIYPNSNISQK
jgi:hypothetical protein